MSPDFEEKLRKKDIGPGDRIRVSSRGKEYKGFLMPPSTGGSGTLVLKLDSGYNVGLSPDHDFEVEKVGNVDERFSEVSPVEESFEKTDRDIPQVSILLAGGTIASRVDYRTGAVKPSFDEKELLSFNPELSGIADIEARKIMDTLSENIQPRDWTEIAEEVKKETDKGKDGVVVAHGTDTMGYTAAALGFMLEDLSVPVVLVGSQRSSDRGSSDAHQNLVCATKAATSDIAEVMVCMHGSSSDDFCYLHPGTKVRKMHTSRRDAFRTVNGEPLAKVDWENLEVEYIRKDYRRKDKDRETKLKDGFNEEVALIKVYPGMDAQALDAQLQGTEGVVLEGTGLGHIPIKNDSMRRMLEEYVDDGNVVFMTSQCLYGRVNMNVYETGVDLQNLGVVGNLNDMLPETAYVKLGWLLGNYDKEKTKELMLENMRGEISQRTEHEEVR